MAENHHSDRLGPTWIRAWGARLLAPALLALLIVGMFWKLVLTDEYTWLESPDLTNQVLPWFQYQAGEWHSGRIPLWEPHEWGGQPLLGQAQPGVAYPLNWILFLAPLHHGWIKQIHLHWYFVLIHVLAALFAYAFCRDLGTSRMAAVLGGAGFALAGYVGGVDWPQMLNASIWIPLIFLYLLRSLRGERPMRNAILGGFFLGLAWLAGHHQIPIFTSLAAGGVWIFYCLRGWKLDLRMVVRAVLFFVVAGATGAIQTVPALEYGKLARRWVGVDEPVAWNQPVPYKVHTEYSLNWSSLYGTILPDKARFGHPYVGLTLLVLAVLAIVVARPRREVKVLAGVGIAGILLSLGAFDFLHGILYALVPMVEKARSPNTAIHLFSFAVSILAAVGLDQVLASRDGAWIRKAAVVLGWTAAILAVTGMAFLLAGKLQGDDRIVMVPLVAGVLAALFVAWRRDAVTGPSLSFALMFLVLLELGSVLGYVWYNRYDKSRASFLAPLRAHGDIAEFLSSRPELVRITRDDAIPYNFGDYYGISEQGGYLASITSNLLGQQLGGDHIWNLFGVNYSIAKEKFRDEQQLVFQSKSGLKVWRNPTALPRAFSVHEARQVKDPIDLRVNFDDRGFDVAKTALILPAPGDPAMPRVVSCQTGDSVQMTEWRPNSLRISARMGCRGLVVVGDTFYPGWQARVDGQPARIWEVDGIVRGVEVGAGEHVVEMVYRPRSVILGGVLSGLGLLAALAAGLPFLGNSLARRFQGM